jgi:hypothetical protein
MDGEVPEVNLMIPLEIVVVPIVHPPISPSLQVSLPSLPKVVLPLYIEPELMVQFPIEPAEALTVPSTERPELLTEKLFPN